MDGLGMMGDLGVGLAWLVLASVLGGSLALGLGVLLLQGRRIPPVAPAAAVALVAASGTITGLLEGLDFDPGDYGVMRIVAMTTSVARVLALLPTGAVASTLLLMLAVVGVQARPHRWPYAALAALGGLVTAGIVVAGGVMTGDLAFPVVRALVYLGLTVPIAIALMGGASEDGNGPEAGAAAALVLPFVVAAGEGARRGLIETVLLVQDLSAIELGNREDTVRLYLAATTPETSWSLAAVGCAMMVGLVGMAANLQGGARSRGALAGAILLPLAPAIVLLGDNGVERLVTLANAAP